MANQTSTNWKPIAVLGCVFGLYLWSVRPVPPPQGWSFDFEEAVIEAKATDKHLLVAFNLHGCGPCAMMDKQVLPDPSVVAAIASFVPVRVDLGRQFDVANRFNVNAAPTYLVVNTDGAVLGGTQGFLPVDEFLKFLDHASAADSQ